MCKAKQDEAPSCLLLVTALNCNNQFDLNRNKYFYPEVSCVLFTPVLNRSVHVTIQMKATEQCFHVVLFIMLYIVVLTFLV